MEALAATAQRMSEQEYLERELRSDVRHEYADGWAYALAGSDARHGLIRNAIAFALTPAVRRKGCQLFTAAMKLRLETGGHTAFYYPDLMVACQAQDDGSHFCRAPMLIAEVLSPGTVRVDRIEKLLAYQSLPSLQAYVLVEQERRHVELYRRAAGWSVEHHTQGSIPMDCLDMTLALDAIYQDVPAG